MYIKCDLSICLAPSPSVPLSLARLPARPPARARALPPRFSLFFVSLALAPPVPHTFMPVYTYVCMHINIYRYTDRQVYVYTVFRSMCMCMCIRKYHIYACEHRDLSAWIDMHVRVCIHRLQQQRPATVFQAHPASLTDLYDLRWFVFATGSCECVL